MKRTLVKLSCMIALLVLVEASRLEPLWASCGLTCSQMKGICQQYCFSRGCSWSFACNSADPCSSTCLCTNCAP